METMTDTTIPAIPAIPASSTSTFDGLPTEVLRSMISYMDVPSLASLSMSHRPKDGNMSDLASDDVTWYALVRERFGIGRDDDRHRRCGRRRDGDGGGGSGKVVMVNGRVASGNGIGVDGGVGGRDPSSQIRPRSRRPASYGGWDWKSAYRALSSTMRMPISNKRAMRGGCAIFASTRGGGRLRGGRGSADCLGVWCGVNHAENCRTRTIVADGGTVDWVRRRLSNRRDDECGGGVGGGGGGGRRGSGNDNVPLPHLPPPPLPPYYRSDRRYLELRICLQNTKSGYGCIVVPDVRSIRILSHEEEGVGEDEEDGRLDDGDRPRRRVSTFRIVEEGPWAPRIASRRRAFVDDDDKDERDDYHPMTTASEATSVILRPFEVIVLSVHVSCPECHAYEIDALSSMSSIHIPVGGGDGRPKPSDRDCGGGGEGGAGGVDDGSRERRDVSIARFLPEDDLWEYYCLLPGGCMSLTDRSRLVPT